MEFYKYLFLFCRPLSHLLLHLHDPLFNTRVNKRTNKEQITFLPPLRLPLELISGEENKYETTSRGSIASLSACGGRPQRVRTSGGDGHPRKHLVCTQQVRLTLDILVQTLPTRLEIAIASSGQSSIFHVCSRRPVESLSTAT